MKDQLNIINDERRKDGNINIYFPLTLSKTCKVKTKYCIPSFGGYFRLILTGDALSSQKPLPNFSSHN